MKETHFFSGMGLGLMVGATAALGMSLMCKECAPVKHGVERMTHSVADGVEHMAHRMGM